MNPVQTSSLPCSNLASFLPLELRDFVPSQADVPRIAKDRRLMDLVESAAQQVPTSHALHHCDARALTAVAPESVHLVLTSPPYWTLKEYNHGAGQLGDIEDYERFNAELDNVWRRCLEALVPGGRLICVVGDVCLSRRANGGRHTVVPLHATIQEHCRVLGFDNLAPIIWYKIANAQYEAGGGGSFLGKPYEPNAIIKNDIEYVLMFRKPGGYRSPDVSAKLLSLISAENYQQWFRQIWEGVTGASTRQHPAPYPIELAQRLVRMFSFVGDTIWDPFMGTGTTNLAALLWGRNSIGSEVDVDYFTLAAERLKAKTNELFNSSEVNLHAAPAT